MLAKILIDNIGDKDYLCEWGLSVFINHEGKNILLDTGASSKFRENARKMGIDLEQTDYGVLSHAHYDHADGLPYFFKLNSKADFYLSENCRENCYGKRWIFGKYIGIKKGIMKDFANRIKYVSEKTELYRNAYILPHFDGDFTEAAKKAGLFVKEGRKTVPDNFNHEVSLVLRTEKGLVILNSCSHAGVENIIDEVREAFPEEKIVAYIGGLHLFRSTEADVLSLAAKVKKLGIQKIYTGHCTGDKAFAILKKELGESLVQLRSGLEIEI
ncbi:MAG: MBL fold metallo-hydrolase [Clostridia bacterium]|nr:MBL fold metallo-hydrolase [Clostridia bacterium]